MKFVKKLPINRSDPMSNRFSVLADDRIVTSTKVSLSMPVGTNADRPTVYLDGQIRFNSITNDLETYNASNLGWELIRTVRPAPITQQTLGPGDYTGTDFGPLRYDSGEYYVDYNNPQNIFVFIQDIR